jgi:hypothetical protein
MMRELLLSPLVFFLQGVCLVVFVGCCIVATVQSFTKEDK